MFSQLGKAFTVLLLNAFMIVGLMLGFGFLQEVAISLYEAGFQTYSDFKDSLTAHATSFLSQETHILFGIIFCVGVITYDAMLFISWLRSFRFTKTKSCKRCHHKIIREPRSGVDRLVSFVIALKRYRCVGCGKEYLMMQRSDKHAPAPSSQAQPSMVRKD